MIFAEVLIGPVLLAIVFLGALTIGSRVAAPIERARRRQMEFTANASHELRTPLSVIEAQTSLALDRERDGTWYRQAFLRVDQESKRMRRLVEDLLWLARMDATADSAHAEPVDVGVVAQQGVDRFAGLAEARDQRLSLAVSGESHIISATAEWLEHLIGVLLDNACKYAPERGSVDVRVAADGDRVRLTVDDSGPGIPEEQRRRIFDRFQRAADHVGGAGLSLAIADAVVRATNGRWEVGTSSSGGASMAISWPRLLSGSRATAPVVSAPIQI
jgi:two-component system sensor histidine kinase TctE